MFAGQRRRWQRDDEFSVGHRAGYVQRCLRKAAGRRGGLALDGNIAGETKQPLDPKKHLHHSPRLDGDTLREIAHLEWMIGDLDDDRRRREVDVDAAGRRLRLLLLRLLIEALLLLLGQLRELLRLACPLLHPLLHLLGSRPLDDRLLLLRRRRHHRLGGELPLGRRLVEHLTRLDHLGLEGHIARCRLEPLRRRGERLICRGDHRGRLACRLPGSHGRLIERVRLSYGSGEGGGRRLGV